MIKAVSEMDDHSLSLYREAVGETRPRHIGYLHWHGNHRDFGSQPRIVLNEAFGVISIAEIETAMAEYRRITGSQRAFQT